MTPADRRYAPRMRAGAVLVAALGAAACGHRVAGACCSATPGPPADPQGAAAGAPARGAQAPITGPAWAVLKGRILRQLAAAEGCGGEAAPPCDRASVTYAPPDATPGEQDPVVLVIDSGDSVGAGLRYASHVLARFRVDEGGALVEIRPTYVVPAAAAAIYAELDQPGTIVPRPLTEPLSAAFDKVFREPSWSAYLTSHMNWVFDLLSSYVPHAYFVLVDTDTRAEAGAAELCDLGPDAQLRIRGRYRRLGAQLHQLMDRYHVGYVNLSAGYSRDQLVDAGWFGCPTSPAPGAVAAFLRLSADFIADLSGHPDVTLVEAAVSSETPLTADDPRAPGDCAELPGRIRAGYFLRKDSKLGPAGLPEGAAQPAPLAGVLPPSQLGAAACADLFVNFGFEHDAEADLNTPGPTPLAVGLNALGFSYKRYVDPATSWAAPLALAHLVHLQDLAFAAGQGRLSAAELLAAARAGDVRVKAVDPLRNHQFTAFTAD